MLRTYSRPIEAQRHPTSVWISGPGFEMNEIDLNRFMMKIPAPIC